MNLNEMELPGFVLASLYPKTLVVPAVDNTAPVVESGRSKEEVTVTPASKSHLGNNRQHILVVVDQQDVPHIPDHELELLTGILTACKLSMDDIALVNRANAPGEDYKDYIKMYKSRIVLLFETTPTAIGLPMNFPQFQPQSFNGTTYLFSPSLQELGNDKVLKSKLWLCLKKIFSI